MEGEHQLAEQGIIPGTHGAVTWADLRRARRKAPTVSAPAEHEPDQCGRPGRDFKIRVSAQKPPCAQAGPDKCSARSGGRAATSSPGWQGPARRALGLSGAGWNADLVEQVADALLDLVSDQPHGGNVLAFGVVERPVFVSLAGEDGAGIPAAHGDHDVGRADDLIGPRLGEL